MPGTATGVYRRRPPPTPRSRARRWSIAAATAPATPATTAFATPLDDVATTLGSGHAAGAPTLVLAPGAGAMFGAPTAARPVRVTATPASNVDAFGRAIDRDLLTSFKATGIAGDTLTGVTLDAGTDRDLAAGAPLAVAVTARTLADVHDAVNALEATAARTTAAYADPAWIASLAGSKLSGAVAGTSFRVGADQVVAARGAAVADATDTTDVITQLNALLARLRAHGLIDP